MKSLQRQARLAIFKNDVDYSYVPSCVYLSLGLPRVSVLKIMQRFPGHDYRFTGSCIRVKTQDPDDGLDVSAQKGCMHSLIFFKSIGATVIERAMASAAFYGHIEIVKKCQEWGANDYQDAMKNAARGGHIEIVKQCEEWGAGYFKDAMNEAAIGGQIDVVIFCKSRGEESCDTTMINAAANGHRALVELLLEWDGDRYVDEGLQFAVKRNRIDIVRLLIDRGASCDYESAILEAAENGHINIIKLFKEFGFVEDFEKTMMKAARHGHTEIVILCKEYGAVEFEKAYKRAYWTEYQGMKVRWYDSWFGNTFVTYGKHRKLIDMLQEWKDTHYDWVMNKAARKGDVELLKESIDKGAVRYDLAVKCAALYGHVEIIIILYERGLVDDFDKPMCLAAQYGYIDVVQQCKKYGATGLKRALEYAEWGEKKFRICHPLVSSNVFKVSALLRQWANIF